MGISVIYFCKRWTDEPAQNESAAPSSNILSSEIHMLSGDGPSCLPIKHGAAPAVVQSVPSAMMTPAQHESRPFPRLAHPAPPH